MSQSVASVDAGRHASAFGRWRDAYIAYSGADENNFTAEDLESFAEAAWWTCRMEEALDLRQRAYAAFTAAGDKRGAARLALALQWDYSSRGALSVSHGWFARAERLLESLPESPEYAQLVLIRPHPSALVSRHRRLPAGGRVDRGGEPMV